MLAALGGAFVLGFPFFAIAAAYLVLLSFYSAFLKHIVILDVLTIAAGFVLRAVAGAAAIDVPISHWLLVCTTLLALVPRAEQAAARADAAGRHRHRATGRFSSDYTPVSARPDDLGGHGVDADRLCVLHDQPRNRRRSSAPMLLSLTIPFPLYGIFRYLYLVHSSDRAAVRRNCCSNDRPLLACVALWGARGDPHHLPT